MQCDTIKKGGECTFMTARGCSYKEGQCYPIVEKCNGCDRIHEFGGQTYCKSYPEPAVKWEHNACNFATHVQATFDKSGQVKINPIKASKRAAKKR